MRGDEHKQDHGKLMWDLLPIEFPESVVKVLTFGAKKYKPNGWKEVPDATERYYAALMRHIAEWRKGNEIDGETGLQHLEHAACNLMFLLCLPKGTTQNDIIYGDMSRLAYTTTEPRPGDAILDCAGRPAECDLGSASL